MGKNFNSKKYCKEKIFTVKMPGSRVMIEVIKELKKKINKKNDFKHKSYIFYQGVEKIKGDYYLIRKNDELIPFTKYLKDNKPSLNDIMQWCSTIACTVRRAAEEGYDLPSITVESLFIDKEKRIKIVAPDVINSIIQYKEDIKSPIKSIEYKAPEIIKGNEQDECSDIYNFGVLMYYLLTEQAPFSGENNKHLYDKILSGSIIEPRYINHQISTELNNFIMKLLNVERDKRLQKWEEVVTQLDSIKSKNSHFADYNQKQINKEKSKKIIRSIHIKEEMKFFFRHHWKKITLLSLLLIGLLYAVFISGPTPVITEESSPEQLVKIFYEGINNSNISVVEETTTVDLGKMGKLISESYILEKMEKAYNNTEGRKQSSVLGIKNLQYNMKEKRLKIVYRAEYIFYLKQEEGKYEVQMNDILILNRINNRWQITEIKGDIKKIINGNFDKLQEGDIH